MSFSRQASSSSTPTFQPIFEKALEEYKKKTGKDLTAHPLAAQIKGCNSPEAILTVLKRKANELKQSRSGDERLTRWLNPTVNILSALSATLGEGAGSVSHKNQAVSSPVCPNVSGIPPYQNHLFWNQYSPRSEFSCPILCMGLENFTSGRQQRALWQTAMC